MFSLRIEARKLEVTFFVGEFDGSLMVCLCTSQSVFWMFFPAEEVETAWIGI